MYLNISDDSVITYIVGEFNESDDFDEFLVQVVYMFTD